jgi:hypothetical protein
VSDRIIRACQEDFEAQVTRLIDGNDAYLDYAALLEDLDRLVGPDASHVLLLEDMGTQTYWQQLGAILGVTLDREQAFDAAVNVRGDDGVWTLRPFNSGGTRQAIFGRQPSPGLHRCWTLRAFRHPTHLLRTAMRPRDASIHVSDDLRRSVRDGCASSNLRLEQRLGRGLSPLGY